MNPPDFPEESPEDQGTRERSEREERACKIASGAARFLLAVGGIAVSTVVLIPGRIAGVSRSARLEWQRRESEISRVAAATRPPTAPEAPAP